MSLYLQVLKKIGATFDFFELNQVPRVENTEADALAKLGSALRIRPDMMIPIVNIMIPAIDDRTQQPNSETQDPHDEVSAINDPIADDPSIQDPPNQQESWTSPIKDYILNDKIPQEEKNERAFRKRILCFPIIQGTLYKKSITCLYLRCFEENEGKEVL